MFISVYRHLTVCDYDDRQTAWTNEWVDEWIFRLALELAPVSCQNVPIMTFFFSKLRTHHHFIVGSHSVVRFRLWVGLQVILPYHWISVWLRTLSGHDIALTPPQGVPFRYGREGGWRFNRLSCGDVLNICTSLLRYFSKFIEVLYKQLDYIFLKQIEISTVIGSRTSVMVDVEYSSD